MGSDQITIILGVLLAISEALAMIPDVKANGIFHAFYSFLHGGKDPK